MSNSSSIYLHECPICFLQYTQVNVATCCAAPICTECYLQVHPPKEKSVTCPFCNNPTFDVRVAKQLDEEYVLQREEEEQKMIEATIRSRSGHFSSSVLTEITNSHMEKPDESVDSNTATNSGYDTPTQVEEFGSNLVRRLRARTESLSSRDCLNHETIMTVSPEERRQLELEMKDQKSHPLVRMLELEAEETRHRHEVEHSERVSRNRFLRRGSLGRRLAVQQAGIGGHTQEIVGNPSLQSGLPRHSSETVDHADGLRMLETALFVAMEERSLRDRTESLSGDEDADGSDSSQADAMVLLQELLSRRQQLHQRQSSSNRAIQRRLALDAQLEAATSMLLSILPEEDQIAMAMAMSIREANVPQDGMSGVENNTVDDNSESVTPVSDRIEGLPTSEIDLESPTAETGEPSLATGQSSLHRSISSSYSSMSLCDLEVSRDTIYDGSVPRSE
jgi:hypothetical protein